VTVVRIHAEGSDARERVRLATDVGHVDDGAGLAIELGGIVLPRADKAILGEVAMRGSRRRRPTM
jgi:hypothetical protein